MPRATVIAENDDYITLASAARLVPMSRPALERHVLLGRVPCRTIGGFRMVRRADLERFKAACGESVQVRRRRRTARPS
jgi:hypothetical protein